MLKSKGIRLTYGYEVVNKHNIMFMDVLGLESIADVRADIIENFKLYANEIAEIKVYESCHRKFGKGWKLISKKLISTIDPKEFKF